MRFFVTCARGTEGPLRRELADLRIRGPRGAEGGVSFEGRFEEGLAACLWSRVGMRVLLELGAFTATSAEELYAGVHALDWAAHLTAHSTLAVTATVRDNPALSHSGFAALKVKDAIVDALRARLGARPDINVEDPDVPITLHLRGNEARIFLDLTGEPLHRRGYRLAMTDAPLKENLAAAILALADADPARPFLDPMAGSGTFAIEQALRARNIAPGLQRRFAFQRWPDQAHAAAWAELCEQARSVQLPRAPAPIVARDIAPEAVEAIRRNAAAAGVAADLTCAVAGVSSLTPPFPTGTLLTNPPYGERLGNLDAPPARPAGPSSRDGHRGQQAASWGRPGAPSARQPPAPPRPQHALQGRAGSLSDRDLERLYDDFGRALGGFGAWNIGVLSGNPMFSRIFLRKPDINHRLWNGPLETRLLVYRPRTA
jgi:23S rRNA G2445 N2-methylase RlmL